MRVSGAELGEYLHTRLYICIYLGLNNHRRAGHDLGNSGGFWVWTFGHFGLAGIEGQGSKTGEAPLQMSSAPSESPLSTK